MVLFYLPYTLHCPAGTHCNVHLAPAGCCRAWSTPIYFTSWVVSFKKQSLRGASEWCGCRMKLSLLRTEFHMKQIQKANSQFTECIKYLQGKNLWLVAKKHIHQRCSRLRWTLTSYGVRSWWNLGFNLNVTRCHLLKWNICISLKVEWRIVCFWHVCVQYTCTHISYR